MKLPSFTDQVLENRGSIAWKSLLLKCKCPAIVCDPIFTTSTTKEIHDVFNNNVRDSNQSGCVTLLLANHSAILEQMSLAAKRRAFEMGLT